MPCHEEVGMEVVCVCVRARTHVWARWHEFSRLPEYLCASHGPSQSDVLERVILRKDPAIALIHMRRSIQRLGVCPHVGSSALFVSLFHFHKAKSKKSNVRRIVYELNA